MAAEVQLGFISSDTSRREGLTGPQYKLRLRHACYHFHYPSLLISRVRVPILANTHLEEWCPPSSSYTHQSPFFPSHPVPGARPARADAGVGWRRS